jgi:hypothetical protein
MSVRFVGSCRKTSEVKDNWGCGGKQVGLEDISLGGATTLLTERAICLRPPIEPMVEPSFLRVAEFEQHQSEGR